MLGQKPEHVELLGPQRDLQLSNQTAMSPDIHHEVTKADSPGDSAAIRSAIEPGMLVQGEVTIAIGVEMQHHDPVGP